MEDVWGEVFTYLSTKDLSRCERVSRAFNLRARNAWRRRKELDTLQKEYQKIDEETLEALLDRIGESMDSIRLGRPSTSSQAFLTSNFRLSSEIPSNLHFTLAQARRISQLYRLKCLSIHRMIVTLNSLEEIQNFPETLEKISFTSCRFEVFSPEEAELAENSMLRLLQRCSNLKTFRIESRSGWCGWLRVTRRLILALPSSLSNLYINLGDSPDLDSLEFIDRMNLTSLGLPQNTIKAVSLEQLLQMKCLRSLDLSYSRFLDNFSILGQIDSLRQLNLSGSYRFLDASLEAICMGCPRLTHLAIDSCFCLTRSSLEKLALLFDLEYLSLAGLPAVNDAILAHISGLAHLSRLDISHCRGVTSGGVEWTMTSLPSLKFISIKGLSQTAQKIEVPIGTKITIDRDSIPVQLSFPPPPLSASFPQIPAMLITS